jgi:large subunit ribosomal protein L31
VFGWARVPVLRKVEAREPRAPRARFAQGRSTRAACAPSSILDTPEFDRLASNVASTEKFATGVTTKVKPDIHPKYVNATVHCACGETWQTRSTKSEIRLEICSNCHPFFTGKQKLIDTAGRVERFNRKYGRKTEA